MIPVKQIETRDTGLQGATHQDSRFEIRALSEDGTFEGYGSIFNNEDSYGDTVLPGAFKATLAQHKKNGTMPALLWQHRGDQPIGVYEEMTENEKGLYVKGRLALDTRLGREAHALLKMGALNGLSIGFVTKKWERTDKGRDVKEVELWEVSLVTFPANGKARVDGVKNIDFDSASNETDFERILREAGASRGEAKGAVRRFKETIMRQREAGQMVTLKERLDSLTTAMKTE
ncbi:MAG: HK97 family phage prohead protease [Henriciella sp.]|nr:HK97 family phage prohead protease [Henriciella sp.]